MSSGNGLNINSCQYRRNKRIISDNSVASLIGAVGYAVFTASKSRTVTEETGTKYRILYQYVFLFGCILLRDVWENLILRETEGLAQCQNFPTHRDVNTAER